MARHYLVAWLRDQVLALPAGEVAGIDLPASNERPPLDLAATLGLDPGPERPRRPE